MATEKETIIFDFQIEQGGAIADLEKTKASIIGLREEQKKLTQAYKEGNITLEEYASESVRVEQVLKKETTTYSNLTKQVQGTKSKTDELIQSNKALTGALDKLAPGLQGTIQGFMGMAKAALAFIATPIGAVIAAIGLALSALMAYFKGTQEGQDRFNKLMNIGAAITVKLTDTLITLGKFIFDNLAKSFELMSNALSYLIPGFDELTKKVSAFLNLDNAEAVSALQEQQRILELQMITRRDALKAEIEAAKLRAAETKDNEVRAAALEEQRTKVNELYDAEVKLAKLEKDIVEQRGLGDNNTFEDNKAIAESIAKISQLERDRSASLLSIAKTEASIREEKQKAFEKELELEQARLDFIADRDQKEIEMDAEKLEAFRDNLIAHNEALFEINTTLANEKISIEEDEKEQSEQITTNVSDFKRKKALEGLALINELQKKGVSMEKATAIVHQQIEQQKLAVTSDALGMASDLFKKNTIAYKVTATAKAVIDTYSAANIALSSYPPPLGAIFAALNIALGLINVGKITGVAAAGGANFTTKGPTLLLVGDNPGGRERVSVEPLSGRGTTRTFGGGIAMAGGGSVNGSILAAASTSALDTQFNLQRALENQPAPILDYREFTLFTNKVDYKEQLTTA